MARRQQRARVASKRRTRALQMRAVTVPAGRRVRSGRVPGTDFPPTAGAQPATPPIETRRDQRAIAPWPLIDRYPFIIGVSLTANYLASCFRLAITGYRQQLVDLLDELMEQDPHLFSVLTKRITSTANGRIEIKPFRLPEDHPDRDLAQKAAVMVQAEIDRIPNLTQSIATLLWGIYYGPTAAEIFWTKDSDGWHVDRFDFIHSRRLSYPDMQSYTLFIWDQGQVLGNEAYGTSPTNVGIFGTPIADWPGKFLVYSPQLRGDYPTREGIGRQVATWVLFKRAGVRGAMAYLERFSKGFLLGTYTTQDEGKPREASPEDVSVLEDAAAKVGPGSGSFAIIPDSTKLEPKGYDGQGTAKISYGDWIDLCDAQVSKAVLGGTLSTDHRGAGNGLGGSGTAEVQERAEVDLEQYDATTFAESFRRDVVFWLVKMNMPEAVRVLPQVFVNVDREPDDKTLLENSLTFTKMGGRVDLRKISDKTGIPLIETDEEKTEGGEVKPMGSFLSFTLDPSLVYSDLKSEEQQQIEQDQRDQAHQVNLIRAQTPVGFGGGGKTGGKNGKTPPGKKGAPPAKGNGPAKGAAAAGKTPPGKGKGAKKLTLDRDEQAQVDTMRVLLKSRPDAPAREVYEQLLEDYPAWACSWVLAGHWDGPQLVPLDEVDFAARDRWKASKDGTVPSYVDKIKGGRMKPVIMVKTPGNPKKLVVDGHHRTLAYESMGEPILAYVAEMHTDHGPWLELHAMQKRGGAGGSRSVSPSASIPGSYTSLYPHDDASFDPKGPASLTTLNAKPNPRLAPAAIALVFDDAGNILTVSRPEPPHEQAFPGGMQDPGENIARTAARELEEETGIVADVGPDGEPIVEPLFITSSPTDGRPVYVYRVPSWTGEAYAAEPATTVEWMSVGDFFAQSVLFRDVIRELMARDLLLPADLDAAAQ